MSKVITSLSDLTIGQDGISTETVTVTFPDGSTETGRVKAWGPKVIVLTNSEPDAKGFRKGFDVPSVRFGSKVTVAGVSLVKKPRAPRKPKATPAAEVKSA